MSCGEVNARFPARGGWRHANLRLILQEEFKTVELSGESLIAAPRAAVWAALNDPAVLARCIDGVETLTATSADDGATRLDGRMHAKVGPVRATFAGGVTLTEVDEPNRYVLVGEGKGGVAGFAKGRAAVTLADAEVDGRPGTHLAYTVTSSVGGKLAQLGARLIEGTARGYAETFFTRLRAEIETPTAAAGDPATVGDPAAGDVLIGEAAAAASGGVPFPTTAEAPGTTDAGALQGTRRATGLSPLVWGGVLILIVLAVLVWQLS